MRPVSWLLLPAICIVLPTAPASAQVSASGASGVVTDQEGKPVSYAHVYEHRTGVATVTDSHGKFTLTSSPGAGIDIRLRRIGFSPLDTALQAGALQGLRLVMKRVSQQLDTVRIRAEGSTYDEYLDRSGYYQRQARRIDGTFISAAQIEKRNATELTAVLRDVNGVRVVSRGGRAKNNFVVGRGGVCSMGLVIDGQSVPTNAPTNEEVQPRIMSIMGGRPVPATHKKLPHPGVASVDELVPPEMIAGLEIYPSAASVPNSLAHHVDGCGLIVVWTRFQ